MHAPPVPEEPLSPREKGHLESAHHELCTALTVLRLNVELVRIGLRHEESAPVQATLLSHLAELELALDRLSRLAGDMRGWSGTTAGGHARGATSVARARLLP